LATSSDGTIAARAEKRSSGELVRGRILVVEDNKLSRELLCDWLEVESYQVASASNLEQAFAAIQKMPPDAVLLDVQLGDQDGLSLATWIRQQPTLSHIPVIAVTAHAMVTEQARIFQAGCNAYVPKPVDFKVLSQQMERWLAVSSASYSKDIT
jgi:two-component system cell cycle response regulator DivK